MVASFITSDWSDEGSTNHLAMPDLHRHAETEVTMLRKLQPLRRH